MSSSRFDSSPPILVLQTKIWLSFCTKGWCVFVLACVCVFRVNSRTVRRRAAIECRSSTLLPWLSLRPLVDRGSPLEQSIPHEISRRRERYTLRFIRTHARANPVWTLRVAVLRNISSEERFLPTEAACYCLHYFPNSLAFVPNLT